ncbi:MAG: hypothetical protein KBA47_00230 [Caldisericia bacterium]|nr:hypothetical protein [Caldisericia bacterium]
MRKKKEIIGEISVHELISKKRQTFHKPTKVQSNKKIPRRNKEKEMREIEY